MLVGNVLLSAEVDGNRPNEMKQALEKDLNGYSQPNRPHQIMVKSEVLASNGPKPMFRLVAGGGVERAHTPNNIRARTPPNILSRNSSTNSINSLGSSHENSLIQHKRPLTPLVGTTTTASVVNNQRIRSAVPQKNILPNNNNGQKFIVTGANRQQQVQYVVLQNTGNTNSNAVRGPSPSSLNGGMRPAAPPVTRTQPPPVNRAPPPPPSTAAQQSANDKSSVSKCAKFFKTLIALSQQNKVGPKVLELVQAVIHGSIMPEEFTSGLQTALNSNAQPHLLPFLQKTLPALRSAMASGEVAIEGISPPSSDLKPPTNIPIVPCGPSVSGTQSVQHTHPAMIKQLSHQPGPIMRPLPSPASVPSSQPSPAGQLLSNSAAPSPAPRPSPALNTIKHSNTPEKFRDQQDDDINDVAAMGGVNLAEESQKILASSGELLQTDTRSLSAEPHTDGHHFSPSYLMKRIRDRFMVTCGSHDVEPEVINLVSIAATQRMKELLERLGMVAEHRVDPIRANPYYSQMSDARTELRFLEELDRSETRKKEDREKEMLFRMSKRKDTKADDEVRIRAKEIQRLEQDEVRNREANAAAQMALQSGSRKRPWQPANTSGEGDASFFNPLDQPLSGPAASNSHTPLRTQVMRTRIKRVNLRDMQMVLSQDKLSRRSPVYYRSVLSAKTSQVNDT